MRNKALLCVLVALACGAGALIAPAVGQPAGGAQPAPNPNLATKPQHTQWEYGELVLIKNDAIFFGPTKVWWIEGPDHIRTRYPDNGGPYKIYDSTRMLHMNRLGAAGWELVETVRTAEWGDAYVMRRRM